MREGEPCLPIVEIDGCTVGLGIGDDLYAPGYWMALAAKKPDFMCLIGSFEQEGKLESLVQARAIDCQSYFVVCGTKSKVINFDGNSMAYEAGFELDFSSQNEFRSKMT